MTDILLHERRGETLVVTLNRPERMNALSRELATELHARIASTEDDASIRAVVIGGAGDRAFCAGADLRERKEADAEGKWAHSRALFDLNRLILASPKLVIAAIDGWCLGGGLELALACDFRVASSASQFGWPEIRLGAYPGAGGAVLLQRLVGQQHARRFLYSGANIDASAAMSMGLVDDVVEPGASIERAVRLAQDMTRNAPLAFAALKRSHVLTSGVPLEEAFAIDGQQRQPLEATEDYVEGITAFFEKRAPVFRGR